MRANSFLMEHSVDNVRLEIDLPSSTGLVTGNSTLPAQELAFEEDSIPFQRWLDTATCDQLLGVLNRAEKEQPLE